MNPETVPEDDEELKQLVELCRRFAPNDPGEQAWTGMVDRIAAALPSAPPRPRWGMRVATLAVAASLALVLIGRSWMAGPVSSPIPEDEAFPVAAASEIHIISVDAGDADRLAMGVPLMGAFDVATPNDVKVEQLAPNPEDGAWPQFHHAGGLAMILSGEGEP